MTQAIFQQFLDAIYALFQDLPRLSDAEMRSLARYTAIIPDGCAEGVVRRMATKYKQLPADVSKAIWCAFLDVAPRNNDYTPCRECLGRQYVWFIRADRPYGRMAKCTRCNQGDAGVCLDLERDGHVRVPSDIPPIVYYHEVFKNTEATAEATQGDGNAEQTQSDETEMFA